MAVCRSQRGDTIPDQDIAAAWLTLRQRFPSLDLPEPADLGLGDDLISNATETADEDTISESRAAMIRRTETAAELGAAAAHAGLRIAALVREATVGAGCEQGRTATAANGAQGLASRLQQFKLAIRALLTAASSENTFTSSVGTEDRSAFELQIALVAEALLQLLAQLKCRNIWETVRTATTESSSENMEDSSQIAQAADQMLQPNSAADARLRDQQGWRKASRQVRVTFYIRNGYVLLWSWLTTSAFSWCYGATHCSMDLQLVQLSIPHDFASVCGGCASSRTLLRGCVQWPTMCAIGIGIDFKDPTIEALCTQALSCCLSQASHCDRLFPKWTPGKLYVLRSTLGWHC
jgi:hypothetical protein